MLRALSAAAILLFLPISGFAQSPNNLVHNSGFELDFGADWQVDPGQVAKGLAYRTEEVVRSGKRALRLFPNRLNETVPGRSDFGVLQSFSAEGRRGKPLYFEAWMNARGSVSAVVRLAVLTSGGQVIFRQLSQDPDPAHRDTFVFHRDILDVPDDPNIIAIFVACAVQGTSGLAHFDDIVVSDDPILTNWRVGQSDPGPPIQASVIVWPSTVIRTIPPNFYGMNLEWVLGGQGFWASDIQDLDPSLTSLAGSLGPNSLRFPGGLFANYYHWRDGIGPHATRKIERPGPVDFITSNDFGTDEAIELADKVGASLVMTTNVVTGTAAEAADWVRYVNRDRRRAEYWEVGNEIYLEYPANPDEVPTPDSPRTRTPPETYAQTLIEYAGAMKAADPSIRIGADIEFNVSIPAFRLFPNWAQVVLQKAAPVIDFLSVHNGLLPGLSGDGGWDVRTVYSAMLSAPLLLERSLRQLSNLIDSEAGSNASRIQIGVTEWGPLFDTSLTSRFADHTQTLASAIFTASAMKVMLENPRVVMTSGFKLNDASTQGWIGLKDSKWTPKVLYYALQLYTQYFQNQVVRTSVQSPTFDTRSIGWADALTGVPYVDVAASVNDSGDTITLIVINKHFDRDLELSVTLGDGFAANAGGTAHILSGTAIDANTGVYSLASTVPQAVDERYNQGGPDEISLTTETVQANGSILNLKFPAHSVTALVLQGRRVADPPGVPE